MDAIPLRAHIEGESYKCRAPDGTEGELKTFHIRMIVGIEKVEAPVVVLNHFPTDEEYYKAQKDAMMYYAWENFKSWRQELEYIPVIHNTRKEVRQQY